MHTNKSFESAEKTLKSSAEKFTPAAAQEAFQPMVENLKAWGELVQEQAQASQAAVTETFEAFKSVKEPQAAFDVMSVAQFKGNVVSLENNLPASEAVTSIANGMKEAASKMESSVESSVDDGAAAVKKARTA